MAKVVIFGGLFSKLNSSHFSNFLLGTVKLLLN